MTAQTLFSLHDDTGPIWTGTCGEFLADKDDMDDADVAEIVNAMIWTGEARFGGGAGVVEVCLPRVLPDGVPIVTVDLG
jgi:hypothetical protein